MKTYKDEEVIELVKQAKKLEIPLYSTTEVGEIETLVKHKLLGQFEQPLD